MRMLLQLSHDLKFPWPVIFFANYKKEKKEKTKILPVEFLAQVNTSVRTLIFYMHVTRSTSGATYIPEFGD